MEAESALFTAAVHAGEDPEDPHGALSAPIYMSSAFAFPDVDRASAIHEGEAPGYVYGRIGTPTQSVLESALRELEKGEAALALASGMAAITTAIMSRLEPGCEVVAPRALYTTTGLFLDEVLAPLGVIVRSVDAVEPGAYAAAISDRTAVVYLETPSNPTLAITDIRQVVAAARKHGATTVLDNTFATPFNQRPLEMGVDLVVHSATKYLGGHGDLMAGAIVGDGELVERARWHTAKVFGGVISPLNAWLVLRGLRTLPLRMARHNANAQRIASFLAAHPAVRRVDYPGLASHPEHELAGRQMTGFGGMVAFDVGGHEAGLTVLRRLKLARHAVSLGDTATLVQLSSSTTHRSASPARRRAAGIEPGLVRLSVGLERAEDIIRDLDHGLAGL